MRSKNVTNFFASVILWNVLFAPIFAHAQHEAGNGGGAELLFKSIQGEVGDWLHKNQKENLLEEKLQLSGISGAQLIVKFDDAVTKVGQKIKFNHDKISFRSVDGKENIRICKNEFDHITCNIDEWNAAQGSVRYAVVFHEMLGIASLENNVNVDYSHYPISSKLIPFVKYKESYELGMDARRILREIDCFGYEDESTQISLRWYFYDDLYIPRTSNKMFLEIRNTNTKAVNPEILHVSQDIAENDLYWKNDDRYWQVASSIFITPPNDQNMVIDIKGIMNSDPEPSPNSTSVINFRLKKYDNIFDLHSAIHIAHHAALECRADYE